MPCAIYMFKLWIQSQFVDGDCDETFLSFTHVCFVIQDNLKLKFMSFYVATLAFGLRPRQGGCEVAGLEVDPGVTSHAPGSAKSPESVRE
jgi:hypothetical protein